MIETKNRIREEQKRLDSEEEELKQSDEFTSVHEETHRQPPNDFNHQLV